MLKIFYSICILLLLNSCVQNNKDIPYNDILRASIASNTDYYFVQELNNIRVQGTYCSAPAAPLAFNGYLKNAATAHARDMAFNKFLEHDGSGSALDIAKNKYIRQSNFIERILFFGYPAKKYDLLGEAVTKTSFKQTKTEDKKKNFQIALQKLIKDPAHCKVLMNPRFRDVGIGYYKAKDAYYWVIDLGETTKE